jgi:hypothetical protein
MAPYRERSLAMRMKLAACFLCLLALQACTTARPPAGITYTPLGVAQKTFPKDLPAVQRGVQTALGTLGMPVREVRSVEEGGRPARAEIVADARDRRITVTLERLTNAATRVDVDVQKFPLKDTATATAILQEIDATLAKP